jgi:hypothetical protein
MIRNSEPTSGQLSDHIGLRYVVCGSDWQRQLRQLAANPQRFDKKRIFVEGRHLWADTAVMTRRWIPGSR